MLYKGKNYFFVLCVLCACLPAVSRQASVAHAGAEAGPPGRSGGPSRVFVDAEGLRPDSPRAFAVYQGRRCVKYGRIGQNLPLAPGQYDIRIGFASGWISRPQTLRAGQRLLVPTGLFRFRLVTPPGLRSTVPQKLYCGDQYLVTGYQGMTARLYPGTYRVRYHAPVDETPARGLRTWRAMGPFPARPRAPGELQTVHPPERTPTPDFSKGCTVGGRTYAWRQIDGGAEMNLAGGWTGRTGWGVVYLATEIVAESQRDVELVITCRGGLRAWLNGRVIKSVPPTRQYSVGRTEAFVTLVKGRNVLLVKTIASRYGYWPFSAVTERWRTYEVAVRAGGVVGPPAGRPNQGGVAPGRAARSARTKALSPVEGIEGIVFCQVPDLPNGKCGLHGEQFRIVRRPKKARICTLIPAAPNGKLTDLTGKHFVAAIHPDLSYDGRKIIFSARETNRPQDHWNIYEMYLDGSGLRRISREMRDCIDPYYLPNGRIIFSSNKPNFRDEYDRDPAMLLFTCKPDGSEAEQITFNLSGDTAAVVLRDGRVLFTSWQHHGEHQGAAGVFALCTVMPDGTGFNLFTGNDNSMSKTKSYAQQLADGRVVFVESAGHRHYNSGALSLVHPRKPLTTRRVLTPGMIYNGHNLAGRYASPYPLPDGGMLCSYSPGRGTAPLQQDPAEDIHLGIYRFDFQAGRPGRLIFDDPAAQDYDAIAIYERPAAPVLPRMAVLGRKTGIMFCVNAYLSDRPKQNNRVVVGELPPAEPGEIEMVRVVEGFGVLDRNPQKHRRIVIDMLQMTFGSGSNGGNAFEQKRVVGYAPVETDGSFNIEVPADTVLSLQTLDKNGMALDTQLTWTWVRPGETRFCVGCHESRETALPNLDCKAMRRPASFVALAPQRRHTVDFRRDVMPIIEKNCSLPKCHGLEAKAGGLDLRKGFDLVFHRVGHRGRKIDGAFFNHAYESLLQAPPNRVGTLVVSNAARYSPLIWRLYGRKLAFCDRRNPYTKKINRMPPAPRKPLTDAEKAVFVEWIDLGAQWDNIPGEDDLPGYDARQSAAMAAEADKLVRKTIRDAKRAFEVRCLECHDSRRLLAMKKMPPADIPRLVKRMVAKRRGWIHDQEIPLIVGHIQQDYSRAPNKK